MSMERKCQLSENTGNNIELDLVSVEKHHIQKVLQHTNVGELSECGAFQR